MIKNPSRCQIQLAEALIDIAQQFSGEIWPAESRAWWTRWIWMRHFKCWIRLY